MGRGLFVTGTDTGVGKTVVSAALMLRYRAEFPLMYWKPIQTGLSVVQAFPPSLATDQSELRRDLAEAQSAEAGRPAGHGGAEAPHYNGPSDDDTQEVARLADCSARELFQRGVRLPEPVSPHLAARLSGMTIDIAPLLASIEGHPEEQRWIVEGAGGTLVPINERRLIIDLMTALALPVVVAARTTLGTINHTLLTLEALRHRSLRVAGVVMIGEPHEENRAAIERYGATRVIGEMPCFAPLTPERLARWSADALDRDSTLRDLMR